MVANLYDKVAFSRKNFFLLPTGSKGKKYNRKPGCYMDSQLPNEGNCIFSDLC